VPLIKNDELLWASWSLYVVTFAIEVAVLYWWWPHEKQTVNQVENGEDEGENIYETIELQDFGANVS
jgi:hypothetical protein